MLHEEVAKYRELSGDTNPNVPISRIGGYLDGYEKALEQEPCKNAISRQAVLDLAKKGVLISNGNYESVCKAINELPPVNPLSKDYNTIYFTPQPKTDSWSIKDVADTFKKHGLIREQEPKTGHWIFVDKAHEHAHCSECDYGNVDLVDGRPHNFCPNCGVKMVEPQESEEA